jgi:hypothetical protein
MPVWHEGPQHRLRNVAAPSDYGRFPEITTDGVREFIQVLFMARQYSRELLGWDEPGTGGELGGQRAGIQGTTWGNREYYCQILVSLTT